MVNCLDVDPTQGCPHRLHSSDPPHPHPRQYFCHGQTMGGTRCPTGDRGGLDCHHILICTEAPYVPPPCLINTRRLDRLDCCLSVHWAWGGHLRRTKGRKNEGQKDLAALNHWPQEDSSIPKWPGAPVFNEMVPKPKLAVFLPFPAAVSQQMCSMEGLSYIWQDLGLELIWLRIGIGLWMWSQLHLKWVKFQACFTLHLNHTQTLF